MSDSKRQCSKCQFFQTAQLSGNGWCTHPKRQVASDVKILVREKELACRNSWGDDLWVDAAGQSAAVSDRTPRKGFAYVNLRVDDEVTSVVDTTARHGPATAGDRAGTATDDIVTVTSIRQGETARLQPAAAPIADDHNAAAIADQAERARHMARGSKDAILKARERHAQRIKPTRTSIAPEPLTFRSDRILDAQDRDHYLRAKSEPARASDEFRNTPPVPRVEIEANGAGPLPTNGDDARFNRPARLDPNVDLSHLRGFLAPSTATSSNGSGRDPGAVTSYDLVLKRALEIRTAGVSGQAASSPTPERGAPTGPPDRTEPGGKESATSAAGSWKEVVWDVGVGGNRLTIAFERARAAIDQPAHDRPGLVAPLPEPTTATPRQEVSQEPDGNFGDCAQAAPGSEPYDPLAEDWDGDAPWIDEPVAGDGDPKPDFHETRKAPSGRFQARGSWWRSLNFGLRRRYQANSEAEVSMFRDYDNDREWYEDDGVVAASDGELGFVGNGAADHDWERIEIEIDPGGNDNLAFGDETPDLFFASTEESWLQDERAFPAPQPIEWHETRTRLLQQAQAPEITDRESIMPTTDHVRRERRQPAFHETVDAQPSDPPTAARSVSTPFSLTEPSGMDAFREALFGGNGVSAAGTTDAPFPPTDDPAPGRTNPGPDRMQTSNRNDAGRSPTAKGVTLDRGGRATRGQSASSAHGFDPDFDIPVAYDDEDDGAGHRFEVASQITKSCRTCQSFRAGDNGERGWCTNAYAKTHRQMVNIDDLACRSSIGDWWIAADAAWIPPASMIHPETPRTDRLADGAKSDERLGVRQSWRVRTSKVG